VHHYRAHGNTGIRDKIIQNTSIYSEELGMCLLSIVRKIRKRLKMAGHITVMGKQESKQNFGGKTSHETETRKIN
jgi:hypothetical protein